jgi:hypothetical protein
VSLGDDWAEDHHDIYLMDVGDTHRQALRALGNRLVGILHGCLCHHTHYDDHTAWTHRLDKPPTHTS